MLDIFNSQAFNTVELTEAINVVPNRYGRLNELNVFPSRGVRVRTIAIERKDGVLNLIQSQPVGAPANKGTVGKRSLRNLSIPHFPYEDEILAEDVQGVRAFGTENQLQALQDLINEKQIISAEKHFITLEYLRWGALTGLILDADGSTLLDVFTEFGVTEKSINFALTTATTDVGAKVRELKRYIEKEAKGAMYSGIHVMCSPEFFDALISHPNVEKFYTAFQNRQLLDQDHRSRFEFHGVVFEEHVGEATDIDGNVRKFIPANNARAFPTGTAGLFATYHAPADFNETVNTMGRPLYAKLERMKFDRGMQLHTQQNSLPICKRPELLVKLTKS